MMKRSSPTARVADKYILPDGGVPKWMEAQKKQKNAAPPKPTEEETEILRMENPAFLQEVRAAIEIVRRERPNKQTDRTLATLSRVFAALLEKMEP